QQMGFEIAARFVEIEVRQRRVVRTRASYQHVVHRRCQTVEEPFEELEVDGVEGRCALCIDVCRSMFKTLCVPPREDNLGSFRTGSPRRFEPDPGTAADHDNSLLKQFWFSLDAQCRGCSAHDCSDACD